jgi:hypothetical protein
VGQGWQILLRGLWTPLQPLGTVVGYAYPQVLAVAPRVLPTSGGGRVTITGSGFGGRVCGSPAPPSLVEFLVAQAPGQSSWAAWDPNSGTWVAPAPLALVPLPCVVEAWADDVITCVAPPGLDGNATVRVVAGGQVNTTLGLVGYAGPLVAGVEVEGPLVTRGGVRVTVHGSDFPVGPWPVSVTVGGAECVVLDSTRSANAVTCVSPRGAGVAAVVVQTMLQASTGDVVLNYSEPNITSVDTPLGRPLEGWFPVVVTGEVRVACWCPLSCTEVPFPCLCVEVTGWKG